MRPIIAVFTAFGFMYDVNVLLFAAFINTNLKFIVEQNYALA